MLAWESLYNLGPDALFNDLVTGSATVDDYYPTDGEAGHVLVHQGLGQPAQWQKFVSSSIVETADGLVTGTDTPVPRTQDIRGNQVTAPLNGIFTGSVRLVTNANFITELTLAADLDVLRFTENVTIPSAPLTSNKKILYDLQGFTLFLFTINAGSFTLQDAGIHYFYNGTIQYTPGSGVVGSSSSLFSTTSGGIGNAVYFENCTLKYGEAVIRGGHPTNRVTVYFRNCQLLYDATNVTPLPAGGNNYRAVVFDGGMSSTSYIYVDSCTIGIDGPVTGPADNLRAVQLGPGAVSGGQVTVTNCVINTPQRVQTLTYYEGGTSSVRTNHRLTLSKNVFTSDGPRNQLFVVIGFSTLRQPLNTFDRVVIVENVFQRHDDDKGIVFIDMSGNTSTTPLTAGSTDVFMIKNETPVLAPPGATRRLLSQDGLIRGNVAIQAVYFQKL